MKSIWWSPEFKISLKGHGVAVMDEARVSKRPESAPLAEPMSYLAGSKEHEHAGLFVDKELQEVCFPHFLMSGLT